MHNNIGELTLHQQSLILQHSFLVEVVKKQAANEKKRVNWTQEREDRVTPHPWMQREQTMIIVLTHTPGQERRKEVGFDLKVSSGIAKGERLRD